MTEVIIGAERKINYPLWEMALIVLSASQRKWNLVNCDFSAEASSFFTRTRIKITAFRTSGNFALLLWQNFKRKC